VISLHEPHARKELKAYQVNDVLSIERRKVFVTDVIEYNGYIGSVHFSADDERCFAAIHSKQLDAVVTEALERYLERLL
jgi:hypothetical protein